MHCIFTPNNAVLFGQRATIQKGEIAKERRSENVIDNSNHVYNSIGYNIDWNTSIISVCIYGIHNMSKRSIKYFFSVIHDEEGSLLDRIASDPHKIFSQKNLVQVNSDRMALSTLRVSLTVAK